MEKNVNEEKLNKFYDSIKEFPIITFPVAKKLIAKDHSDKTINEIFLGSLHAIYNYLSSRNYASLDSGVYDMDDIINTLVAEWLERLKSGDLEKSTSYSNAIQGIIISPRFRERLGVYKNEANQGLSNIFLQYTLPKLVLSEEAYSYEDYLSDLKACGLGRGYESHGLYYYLVLVIEVLRTSDFHFEDSTFIRENTSLLMNYAYNYLNPPAEEEKADMEVERLMENSLDKEFVREIFANPKLNAMEIAVAKLIYGFEDGIPLTFDETAERLGIYKSKVQFYLKNFLTKTRKYSVVKNISR